MKLQGPELEAWLERRRAGRYNHLKAVWGDYFHHHDLYPMLGFKSGAHLPKEGFPERELNGVLIKCDPVNEGKHRIKYLCTGCVCWIPVGRSMQHKCKTIRPRRG